jgi:hypothetical protein
MPTEFYPMPYVTLPFRRVSRPPLRRLLAFGAIVTLCLAVDVLVVLALYKAGAALLAELDPWTLAQIALMSTVLLYLIYRLRGVTRTRATIEVEDKDDKSVDP